MTHRKAKNSRHPKHKLLHFIDKIGMALFNSELEKNKSFVRVTLFCLKYSNPRISV